MQAPNPAVILASMPAVEIKGRSDYNVAIKHTDAATKALREMGFRAPSPVISYYKWPGKFVPFAHQRVMVEFMVMNRRCFNLSEMGTAKTNAVLWAMDWLMTQKRVKKCLIIAPLSTLERVWLVGIFETLMHRSAAIVHGSRDKRKVALAMDVDFYIINHDGLSIGEIRDIINKRDDIDACVVDEGGMFRNANTDRWRALDKTVNAKGGTRWLWWLTGTPCPNGPDDCWAQCKLVNPSRVPRFYGAFRNLVMFEVQEHIWKPRPDGYKHAYDAMQPAIRFNKAECLDLPPVVTEDWTCELSAEQTRLYKEMATDMVTEAKDARANGIKISAANAADKITKLRQILLGSVKTGENEYTALDNKPRLKALLEAIKLAKGKVYIIVPFKGAIKMLEAQLVAAGITVGMINGDVSIGARNRIIADFKNTPNPHALLCHPKVMAHGLNLTEADVLIFYGPIYSNDEYRQVVERFNRPGQTRKMTIIRIGANKLEWAIYKMPDTREVTQATILALYDEVIGGAK